MPNAHRSPKYNVAIVEAVILEVAVELHPQRLTASELTRQVIGDPHDAKELRTAAETIRNLREVGLFAKRNDAIVEPTPAALRACALLT